MKTRGDEEVMKIPEEEEEGERADGAENTPPYGSGLFRL